MGKPKFNEDFILAHKIITMMGNALLVEIMIHSYSLVKLQNA